MINSIYRPPDLGRTLAELRKAAGITQAGIAKSLKVDQSSISRIEKGNVMPSENEIEEYLSALDTEEAETYREFLKQRWKHLERPPFRHPQRDELCKAESSLQKLEKFKSYPKVSKQQINEAQMYGDTLLRSAKYLADLNHSIVYVGAIGIGKTTAVCKLTGLFNPSEAKFNRQSILATGNGRTTVCEVRIRRGEKFGLIVHPLSEDELNKVIKDLWTVLKNSPEQERDNPKTDVSWEILRALRNRTGLNRDNPEDKDPLLELLNQCDKLENFHDKILDKLTISEWTTQEIWFEDTSEQTNFERLKNKFKAINFSLDKEFPLPQRIDVLVPDNVFQVSPYQLEIVDTKGVDVEGTAIRQDLINYLDDPRTLTVLCCKFTDAPGELINSLIDNLIETRKKAFKERVIILILPHDEEALKMTDNTGDDIETEEEAYNQKQNEVQSKLNKLQQKSIEASDIPILFFNAKSGLSVQIAEALNKQLEKLRWSYINPLLEAVNALDILIEDVEDQNAREAHKKVIASLKTFLKYNSNLPQRSWLFHDELLKEMKKAHQRKVLATTRRRGTSESLNVYVLLGNGARNIAWNCTNKAFYGLLAIIELLLGDSELKPAHNFLKQILDNWSIWREDFLKYAEQTSKQTFLFKLEDDFIWEECSAMYGQGGKFQEEVIKKLEKWFNDPDRQYLQYLLKTRIEKAWQEKVLEQLKKLTDDGIETD